MSRAKGLNSTESKNRFRFEKISERLSRVNVDVVHKVRQVGTLDAVIPDSGSQGCYLQDELERCKDFDLTSYFKRFYYELWPLVQSLPELLHNLPLVTTKLKEKMRECPMDSLNSFLQLLSVLGRDIQDEMFAHIFDFFDILTALVDKASLCGENVSTCTTERQADPEMTGKIFECMSHLIRYKIV
jgi:U3 small nucleolar RNA-associated protein 20